MSVSLGEKARDYALEITLGGEPVRIERRGAGGDLGLAQDIIREYDGRVDAFGLGGVNLHYTVGPRRYALREGWALRRCARVSFVADGVYVKEYIEPLIVDQLGHSGVQFYGGKAVVASGLDRWYLAVALERAGCEVAVLDAALALRVPLVFRGTRRFGAAARLALPVLRHTPLNILYPRSIRPDKRPGAWAPAERHLASADILAGDSYLLWRDMPADLRGKTVVFSTATRGEIDEAFARGASVVASLSPGIEGRSVGANVVEAVISAIEGRPPGSISREEYLCAWHRLGLGFRIERRGR